ncbi:MAG: hypothetical protein US97_C0002G0003 [Microgenomates group bacterium GW2011_GWF1_38_5]|uniref:Spore protein YkvP/CgeB glycosyl transferase-like domain-containing protein n=1 Tax=Candidatus Collierbacteria bacterium RIFOXYA2_FULL_46_10 TaxID=1817726 RepID=A0A1F5F6W7_9BACT|nr:MAG: hypothetical protein US97_C0002G0003 [Microgenomates group bacterium GW2011_GWF1_38_5]KKU43078.1 MAG: hypothetical protein UX59_C0030G0007 [Microgenomates group bacterium GW2011_GWA1_46_7]OGD75360.1 MAG: hypothetical protein A2228_00755 [Candidatus Collierbacteria bacterium RIFOXYA2_FULL_46_10]OGJ13873.1 MAG: hypothetical protein A2585_01670 [Candidatus Nomurabacteria bacterium RIFOXYD1_FULL_39_12]
MRMLIVDTYYPGFLRSFWKKQASPKDKSYRDQLLGLLTQRFGTSDYYSYNLRKIGVDVKDIVANDEVSQKTWAKENSVLYKSSTVLDKLRLLPYLYRFLGRPDWISDIVLAQVNHFHPNVVYLQDLSIIPPKTLKKIKLTGALLVGQIACPLPPTENLREFDLILTSFPHYVSLFRKKGIDSEYFRIGFESRLLDEIGPHKRIYDITFVGSFSPYHLAGTKLLESVARHLPVHIWGNGLEYLSPTSPLRAHYHGEAWGKEMYKILAKSKIVINRHISSAGKYANNMRLYESTGMGAMLMTEQRINLSNLFEPGKEVVTYRSSQELLSRLQYYLAHPKEREKIALAGQNRTRTEHTYVQRMKELDIILKKYYAKKRQS